MKKFSVRIDTCPYGYLRYGHFEGIVEAENREELEKLLEDEHPSDIGLNYVLDDYSIEDNCRSTWESPEIEEIPSENTAVTVVDNNGGLILNPDVANALVDFEEKIKELKAKEDEIKEKLMTAMKENGIVKFENNDVRINYVAPTTKETFDSKALKAECPQIYDGYVKISNVKESVKITLKKK